MSFHPTTNGKQEKKENNTPKWTRLKPMLRGGIWCAAREAPGFFFSADYKMQSKHDRCQAEGCGRSASFGMPPSRRRIFCTAHKAPGMKNVSNPLCKNSECIKQATFGFPSGPRRVFCSEHKAAGMIHTSKPRGSAA